MAYCVYCHTNKENWKKYFGITCQKPEIRWKNGTGYSYNARFWNAIKKYGWDGFEHEILIDGLGKEDACQMEIKLIKEFMSFDAKYGYNITMGGEGASGVVVSKETKAKRSKALKGHKTTEQTKQKIGKALTGKPKSDEHREKLRIAAKRTNNLSKYREKSKKPVYCVEMDMVYGGVLEAAIQLKLHASNISRVCRNTNATTGGYHFRYVEKI